MSNAYLLLVILEEQIQQSKLRWFDYVKLEEENIIRRKVLMNVVGRHPTGTPNKILRNFVQEDLCAITGPISVEKTHQTPYYPIGEMRTIYNWMSERSRICLNPKIGQSALTKGEQTTKKKFEYIIINIQTLW